MKKRLSPSFDARKLIFRIVLVIALVYVISIITLYQRVDDRLMDVDADQIVFVEHLAKIEFASNTKGFTKVFDAKTREFIEEGVARKTVKPYGMAREHRGMYILVDVDSKGNITCSWVSP